jgi:histidyl-tRNA synthetase
MKICNELWMAEIKAEYQIMECSLDEVVNYCKEQGITWIVMLKKDGNVKIKNLRGQKQEAEIKRSEIVEYMLIQINTQQKIDTEKAGFEKKENKKYKRRM